MAEKDALCLRNEKAGQLCISVILSMHELMNGQN